MRLSAALYGPSDNIPDIHAGYGVHFKDVYGKWWRDGEFSSFEEAKSQMENSSREGEKRIVKYSYEVITRVVASELKT